MNDWILALLQSVIIAVGNSVGIAFASWLFIDRKIDKKITKYWRQVRNSPEGKDMLKILEDTRNLLESEEAKNIMKELKEGVSEFRVLLRKMREKAESSGESEEETDWKLPELK